MDSPKEFWINFRNQKFDLNAIKEGDTKGILDKDEDLKLIFDLVMNWQEFKKKFIKERKQNKTDPRYKNVRADLPFVELYNTGRLYEDIFNTVGKISTGSLYRWKRLLGYNGDWTCLVGQYKYTTTSRDILSFKVDGYYVKGHTLTLYKVANGNFATQSLTPEDF